MRTSLSHCNYLLFTATIQNKIRTILQYFYFSMPKATEEQASNYMKLIVIISGATVTCLVFFVEKMGTAFQIGSSITGVSAGCHLGIFTLGMTCKTANTKVNILNLNLI